jgi:hypothetical protein
LSDQLNCQLKYQLNYQGHLLAGVDEVGRGPLAGDVVTAAVILDENAPIAGPINGVSNWQKKYVKKHCAGMWLVPRWMKLTVTIFCRQP